MPAATKDAFGLVDVREPRSANPTKPGVADSVFILNADKYEPPMVVPQDPEIKRLKKKVKAQGNRIDQLEAQVAQILASDFSKNQAMFRKDMDDLNAGMEGSGINMID